MLRSLAVRGHAAAKARSGLGETELADVLSDPARLSNRTVRASQEVLAGRRQGLWSFLPFVGPAVIASVAYVDPGNFATNVQAGTRYGYGLLWVVTLANLIAMLFQALAA